MIQADERVNRDINFFNDWATHRQRDEYWLGVDGTQRPETLTAPVLLMAGWYDPFLPSELDDFVRIRRGAKPQIANASQLIIGPWSHARPVALPGGPQLRNYRLESIEPSLAWFDRHLRGAMPSPEPDAPIKLYVMGANVWRQEQEWPLARTRYTPYYLHSDGSANTLLGDGSLSLRAPTAAQPPDTYTYDPQRPVPTAGGAMFGSQGGIARQETIEQRPDVLVYTTAPLEEDLEVTGPVALILFVSTTAPETDFTGKLVDVHPDGSAYNVSDGILRRSYRGARFPEEVRIELWPTSMVFLKGHRIRLEVSSSNYPRFDRHPNTGGTIATEQHPVVAIQSVHHGVETPSHLLLPVIPIEEPTH